MDTIRSLSILTILAVGACADGTGPEDAAEVAVRFEAAPSTQPQTLASASAAATAAPAGPITLTGGGHTLVLEDIRLIVSELELEGRPDACVPAADEDEDDDHGGCEKFEGGPFLVDLLNVDFENVVTALVPAGVYEEFEFEVEDLEVDDGDDHEGPRLRSLLAEMRQAYPAFPEKASVVVSGRWDGTSFTVYFEAEIEVEREFESPFRVPEDGAITVNLDPASWFMNGGVPLDLSAWDGQTVEFELEFEEGLEIDHDD